MTNAFNVYETFDLRKFENFINLYQEQSCNGEKQNTQIWNKPEIASPEKQKEMNRKNILSSQLITGKILHSLIMKDFVKITCEDQNQYPPHQILSLLEYMSWDNLSEESRSLFELVAQKALNEDEFAQLNLDIQLFQKSNNNQYDAKQDQNDQFFSNPMIKSFIKRQLFESQDKFAKFEKNTYFCVYYNRCKNSLLKIDCLISCQAIGVIFDFWISYLCQMIQAMKNCISLILQNQITTQKNNYHNKYQQHFYNSQQKQNIYNIRRFKSKLRY